MAINQLKLVISILKEISEDNNPKADDYGIDSQKFWDIVEAMRDEGLIKEVMILRGGAGHKVTAASLERAKITIKGMEYLHQNSALVKTYKGLKEVREWLPF